VLIWRTNRRQTPPAMTQDGALMSGETDEQEVKIVPDVTMMGCWTDPAAVELLESSLVHATHLKPLWERILVKEDDGRVCIGLPLATKVTEDNLDNHARHFWSLLNLLGLPLVPSPMALDQVEFPRDQLRPLHYIDPKAEKAAAKAAAAEQA